MTFYEEMAGIATELLAEFRQGMVTLTRAGELVPPVDPWEDPTYTDPQTFTLDATVKGVSEKFISGTTIVASDLEITAAPFGDEMRAGDELQIDGKPVEAIRVMRIPSAGVVVAWKFIVRS